MNSTNLEWIPFPVQELSLLLWNLPKKAFAISGCILAKLITFHRYLKILLIAEVSVMNLPTVLND